MERHIEMMFLSAGLSAAVLGGTFGVKLDASADRSRTPLAVEFDRIGTIRPRAASEIRGSNWTLGCEVLDRDFANFEEYKEYLVPLGIKTIRLQGGWAKCEKEKGRYDFSWLDRIVDYACSKGLNVLLETDYGNPIYPGGGGWDLSGGFPSSQEGLAAWDAWVDALSRHFKGRVRDWAMWNEPDNQPRDGSPRKSVEQIAEFNVRTARIIRHNIPDSRIAGLSLARNDPAYFESCLKAMGDDVKLFDWFIYHGYVPAPEASYANVEGLKAVLAKYNPAARMRQGENGAPSEMTIRFAMGRVAWSEYSQAKWDMRRMLGDLGHDVESSVFTICDFNHIGITLNLKGLLRADEEHNVIAVKRAYYAVQNVVSVFDDAWSRVGDSSYENGFGTRDETISTYEYRRETGERLFVFWVHGRDLVADSEKKGDNRWIIPYERPGDSFTTRPAVFRCNKGRALQDPVWVDLFTGRIYAFPKANVVVSRNGTVRYLNVPVYDSPCLLTERSAIIQVPYAK
ncbi:MAG: beta-galactosidase [Kiritimatiellae bacterium]|nr:beta-galactosidase [Kiritimatiellia bacterium]